MFDRVAALGIGLLALLALAATVVGSSARRPSAPAPLAPDGETAYARALGTRVAAAAEEARALVVLGDRRSRNLLEIRAAQRRMEDALAEVDAVAAGRTPSQHTAPALAAYREGASAVRDAMDEAQAGFVRFDWDRVARAYDGMASGADRLAAAAAALGVPLPATPIASAGD